ncbi:MAG: hypothetical protein GOMPHAMPRED_002160 [Gomphillus americanus]|uniref:Uncharacterized protein n=1 Tax=Gomphillus americanus TaxID=1940652 RepID=A0A8H3IMP0_9LECA|nr:MAG: hypothetical protein GOMPHAMPRED_002160 [Gomphillus americanus]
MVKRILNSRDEGYDKSNPPSSWPTLQWTCQHGTVEILELRYKAGQWFSSIETPQPSCFRSILGVAPYWGNTDYWNANGNLIEYSYWKTIGERDLIKVNSRPGGKKVIGVMFARTLDRGPSLAFDLDAGYVWKLITASCISTMQKPITDGKICITLAHLAL